MTANYLAELIWSETWKLCQKVSVLKCNDIFMNDILVCFKMSLGFSIVCMGKIAGGHLGMTMKMPFFDLLEQKQFKSKQSLMFPSSLLFIKTLWHFSLWGYACFCTFPFFLSVFSRKKTNGKCKEGCIWSWQKQWSTEAHASLFVCVYMWTQMCTSLFHFVCAYGHGCVYLFMRMYICMSL